MAEFSRNDNVKIGEHIYHIQTEYYKSSDKIVSNIFMDGKIIKRLEKAPEPEADISLLVSEFHQNVLRKLKSASTVEEFKLSPIDREKLIDILNSFYGIATATVIDDAARNSRSIAEFVNSVTTNIENADEKAKATEEINKILGARRPERQIEKYQTDYLKGIDREKLASILNKYFGVVTYMVLEDATRKSNIEEFAGTIISHLEDESDRARLRNELSQILPIEKSVTPTTKVEKVEEEKKPAYINKDALLPVLSEFFGITTMEVIEDSLNQWKASGKTTFEEFVEVLCDHLTSDEEKEKLRSTLLKK